MANFTPIVCIKDNLFQSLSDSWHLKGPLTGEHFRLKMSRDVGIFKRVKLSLKIDGKVGTYYQHEKTKNIYILPHLRNFCFYYLNIFTINIFLFIFLLKVSDDINLDVQELSKVRRWKLFNIIHKCWDDSICIVLQHKSLFKMIYAGRRQKRFYMNAFEQVSVKIIKELWALNDHYRELLSCFDLVHWRI